MCVFKGVVRCSACDGLGDAASRTTVTTDGPSGGTPPEDGPPPRHPAADPPADGLFFLDWPTT